MSAGRPSYLALLVPYAVGLALGLAACGDDPSSSVPAPSSDAEKAPNDSDGTKLPGAANGAGDSSSTGSNGTGGPSGSDAGRDAARGASTDGPTGLTNDAAVIPPGDAGDASTISGMPVLLNATTLRDDGVVGVGALYQGPCASNASKLCKMVSWPAFSKHAAALYETDALSGATPSDPVYSVFSMNDTIFYFNIRQYGDENGNLVRVEMEFIPAAYASDQQGDFVLTTNGKLNRWAPALNPDTRALFKGTGSTVVRRYDGGGHYLKSDTYGKEEDAIVFANTGMMFEQYPPPPQVAPCTPGLPSCVSFVNSGQWPIGIGNHYAPLVKAKVIITIDDPTQNPLDLVDLGKYRLFVQRYTANHEVEQLEENIRGIGHPWVVSTQIGYVAPDGDHFRWLRSVNEYPTTSTRSDYRCAAPGFTCGPVYLEYPRLPAYHQWLLTHPDSDATAGGDVTWFAAISALDLQWYQTVTDPSYLVTFETARATDDYFEP